MDIVRKTSKGKTIFVFTFKDADDRDFWINKWLECADVAGDVFESYNPDYLKSIILKLKNRIDNKYANSEHEFSGMLFADEFVGFAFETTFLMCVFKDRSK